MSVEGKKKVFLKNAPVGVQLIRKLDKLLTDNPKLTI